MGLWLLRIGLLITGAALATIPAEWALRGPLETRFNGFDGWRAELEQTEAHRALHGRIYRPDPDPELIYTPNPGTWLVMAYGAAGFDLRGRRRPAPGGRRRTVEGTMIGAGLGIEPPQDGPDSKVVVLGDSVAWGSLLDVGDAMPAQLESLLADPDVVVGNYGASGYDLRQSRLWYERVRTVDDPDVVVIVACLNDTLLMSGPLHWFGAGELLDQHTDQRERLAELAPVRNDTLVSLDEQTFQTARFKTLALLQNRARRFVFEKISGYTDEYLLAWDEPSWREPQLEALRELGHAIQADGSTPVLLISPGLYRWRRYPWEPIHEHLRGAGEAAGFVVVDPIDEWRERWRAGDIDLDTIRFEGDNIHYTAAGSQLLAEAIAPVVAGILASPTPDSPTPDSPGPAASRSRTSSRRSPAPP